MHQNVPSPQEISRVERAISRFLIFCMITLAFFAIINTSLGFHALATIQCAVLLILPLLYVWLKHGGSQILIKHTLGVVILIIFAPLLFMPSIEGTGIYWLFAYPLVAFFFLGVRTGIQWTTVYLITTSLGLLLAYLEYIPLYYNWTQIWLGMVELILAGVISYFFVSDNETAEAKLQTHVHYLKSVDSIERSLHNHLDMQPSITASLQTLLEIFQCCRVCLLHPCDPQASTWSIPFESISKPLTDIHLTGKAYPIDSTMRDFFVHIRNSNQPICYDDRNPFGKGSAILQEFSIQSSITMALRPNQEETWILCMHQCDHARHWSSDEQRLFKDIALRMEDALQQMLLYQDIKTATTSLRKAKKEAEKANHAKSEFLSVMSHELRTPLHGIIGLQDLIASDPQHLTSEQLAHLTLAQQAAKSLADLVNDILNLSKVESGTVELNQQEFPLKKLMLDAVAPFIITCKNKRLQLQLQLEDTSEFIVADEVRLRQILINIIGNAVKFTEQGKIHVHIKQLNNHLLFSIKDTGVGMNESMLQHIFEPFRQEAQLMQDKHTGTGLGTTIAKRFVELLGGNIRVESELGAGSCFTFQIPFMANKGKKIHWQIDASQISNTPPTSPQVRKPTHPPMGNIHILLAEDDPIGQRIAAKRLRKTGMLVDIAEDGFTAWVKAQTGQHDLLLTDIRMPKLDGIELTKRIRQYEQEHDQPRLPIIGLSAHALSDVELLCMDAGMDTFMTKPIDPDTVLAKVEELMQKNSQTASNYSI